MRGATDAMVATTEREKHGEPVKPCGNGRRSKKRKYARVDEPFQGAGHLCRHAGGPAGGPQCQRARAPPYVPGLGPRQKVQSGVAAVLLLP